MRSPSAPRDRATGPAPSDSAHPRFEQMLSDGMRTPLNGILALAELLERQPLAGDGAAYVRTIAEHSRSLLRLVTEAGELAAAARGELALNSEPVRVRDILDEVQTRWLPRAACDGVGLGALYEGEPALSADLDRARLQHVFDALVGEALRFTRRGGVEIGLKTQQEGARVTLHGHVLDTGPSLEPGDLAALFHAPTGAPSQSARPAGLGYALSRTLLEAMGGRIWAENNPGTGLVVRFTLEALTAETGLEGADAAPALQGRILIVDDNATNRMVAQTLVELFGCTCETAADGLQAVEAARRGRFDAVLMDIRMPRMDGVAATAAIHALPGAAANLPVIALTANVDPEDARAYVAAGMCEVVEKPIKAERLLAALSKALAEPPLTSRTVAAA